MEFIPSLPVLAAFTLAGLVLNLTPGPDMTLQLNRALSEGRAAAVMALFGTVCGILVHITLAAIGISALIATSEVAFTLVKFTGAIYLLWLAIGVLRKGSAIHLNGRPVKKHTSWENWMAGFAINLLNPKIVLFFITFLPQFVSVSDPNATGKLAFLGLYFAAFSTPVSLAFICLADQLSANLQKNRRFMRLIDYVFASVFGAFAVKMLLTRGSLGEE